MRQPPIDTLGILEVRLTRHSRGAAIGSTVGSALASWPDGLPGYEASLDHAARTLADDGRMAALDADDLVLLRDAFATHRRDVAARTARRQPLHGEPHTGNVLIGPTGLVLIDLEGVCEGPREWDLAAAPPGVAAHVPGIDADLLSAARLLRSAFVAVWCWASADHPDMRPHGEHHLAVLRAATP